MKSLTMGMSLKNITHEVDMNNEIRSWKTTFLGVAAIIAVIAKWVQAGHIDPNDLPSLYSDIIQILLGIGLIAAKDFDVTGTPK